ncbi:AAA domain-containing protein [Actinoplanes sp. GCM10030250]|uniref:AAA domain-containing protein n=1 Tax=Actinoplanes sp. GCM10030250 TaxID=3273376 RepID=UPI003622EF63
MVSTSVDLGRDEDRFCAALEDAVAAGAPGLDERVQRDAIIRLRAGATANPGLLHLLAGGRWAQAGPPEPGADVVRHALGVPDVFCLVAPPGVNRALTVLEIVRAAAERGERVLIAASTTAALDTIVSRLPDGPMVVRTDQAGGGPGTLDAVAAGVQKRVLARSQAAAHRLDAWLGDPSPAKGWLRRLGTSLEEAREARKRADLSAAERDVVIAAARERLGGPVREARLAVEAAAVPEEPEHRLGEALLRAESSRLLRWRAPRLRARLARADAARAELAERHRALADERERLESAIDRDTEVRSATERAALADVAARRVLESAERSAHQLARMLTGVMAVPEWTADAAGLERLAGHCREAEPVLRARAGLIREWRQRAARPSRQLHPELLRYADVVATTCLGAGRPGHGDLEFDLVVVEDAGRVTVPVALVPLVRARRAVLVGSPSRGSVLDLLAARAPEANRADLS